MVGIFMMVCGGLYTSFYIGLLIGAIMGHGHSEAVSRNASLSVMGSCFLLAGAIKIMFARATHLGDVSLDASMPIGLGTLALAAFLHGASGQQQQPNVAYYTFGVFMTLSALADLVTQTISWRFRSLFGTLLIASAALLTASSDEIVGWATKDGAHMGIGTLMICCLLFATLHPLVFAFKAYHIDPYDFDYPENQGGDVMIQMEPMGAYESMSSSSSSPPPAPFIKGGGGGRNGARGPAAKYAIDSESDVEADGKQQQQE